MFNWNVAPEKVGFRKKLKEALKNEQLHGIPAVCLRNEIVAGDDGNALT